MILNRAAGDQNKEYEERIDKKRDFPFTRNAGQPSRGKKKVTTGHLVVGANITREETRTKAEIMTTDGKSAPETKKGARRMITAAIATGKEWVARKAKGE